MLSTNTIGSSKPDPTTNLDWALKYAKIKDWARDEGQPKRKLFGGI